MKKVILLPLLVLVLLTPSIKVRAENLFDTNVSFHYQYEEFEPYIDKETMELHYTKYYASSRNHLEKICDYYPQLQNNSLKKLLTNDYNLPQPVQITLKKVAGDVYNHTFFFEILSTQSNQKPLPKLRQAIIKTYGSFENFKSEYIEVASKQTMYGFIWLVVNKDKQLDIIYTNHYDTPNLKRDTPILAMDTWVHSYYLRYDDSLSEYLTNIFEIIDWQKAEQLYIDAIS